MKHKIRNLVLYLLVLAGVFLPIVYVHRNILKGRTVLLPGKWVMAIAIDGKDRVWVATRDDRVFMIEDLKTTSYDINVHALLRIVGIDENDQAWVIVDPWIRQPEGGNLLTSPNVLMYGFNGNGWTFQKEIPKIPNQYEIYEKDMPCCEPGAEFFVTVAELREYSAFLNPGASSYLRDKQGNLWAGTSSGLIRISPDFHLPRQLPTDFHIFLSSGGYWLLGLILTALYGAILLDVFSQVSLGIALGLAVFFLFSGSVDFAVFPGSSNLNTSVFSILGGMVGGFASKGILRERGGGKRKEMLVVVAGLIMGCAIGFCGFVLQLPWGDL